MTMLSQTSFISASSSARKTNIDSSKLFQIETDVFNRLVDLKNEKIRLLTHLSQLIDTKYEVEAELRHLLQIKKQKQQNLAYRQQYEPVVHRNIALKLELQELQRQIRQRANQSRQIRQSSGSGIIHKSRRKSAFQSQNFRLMSRSNHSRSNKEFVTKTITQEAMNAEEDQLIDQILSQRKLIDSLTDTAIEQKKFALEQQPEQIKQKQTQSIKKKMQSLQKLLQQREQSRIFAKLSKTKSIKASEPVGNQNQKLHQSDLQVEIKQLLKFIEEEEEEKKLLYQELNQFVQEMAALKVENGNLKAQLRAVPGTD